MGSTGKGWRCPWCGVVDKLGMPIAGTSLDQIGYPICQDTLHANSCLTKALRGITRNGVRAGALFHILREDPSFDLIHRAFPNIYLELADLLYGEQGEDTAGTAGNEEAGLERIARDETARVRKSTPKKTIR